MRRMGWNLRRDRSERPIVQALRQAGAKVILLDKFDMLVLYRDRLTMLDAKTGRAKPTEGQHALLREGWPLRFVASVEEAFKEVGVS